MANNLVISVNLNPWALVTICGALRRDSVYWRKESEKDDGQDHSKEMEIARDDETIYNLLTSFVVNDLLSVSLIPCYKEIEAGNG